MRLLPIRLAIAAVVATVACADGRDGPARHARPATERPVLNAAFAPGYSVELEGRRVAFEVREAGAVKLASDRLVACDPFICMDARPFTRRVPTGEFPLVLAIARVGPGDERVALAKIAFSREPVVSWEMALIDGQDPAGLEEDEFFGYGVDAGTGAFMDAETWRWYDARMERDRERFSESLIARLGDAPFVLLPADRGTVALVHSGWGDGAYPTYWGFDAQGRLAAVVTDFLMVP